MRSLTFHPFLYYLLPIERVLTDPPCGTTLRWNQKHPGVHRQTSWSAQAESGVRTCSSSWREKARIFRIESFCREAIESFCSEACAFPSHFQGVRRKHKKKTIRRKQGRPVVRGPVYRGVEVSDIAVFLRGLARAFGESIKKSVTELRMAKVGLRIS